MGTWVVAANPTDGILDSSASHTSRVHVLLPCAFWGDSNINTHLPTGFPGASIVPVAGIAGAALHCTALRRRDQAVVVCCLFVAVANWKLFLCFEVQRAGHCTQAVCRALLSSGRLS